MFMAPDSWKGLYANTLAQAQSGEIPMARLDDAVRRILRVKLRAHLFDKGAPVDAALRRPFRAARLARASRGGAPGGARIAGAAEERQAAAAAVAQARTCWSPATAPTTSRKQSGGWTITWQGTGLTNADFPHAQSIWSGIDEAVRAAGGTATLSVDGSFTRQARRRDRRVRRGALCRVRRRPPPRLEYQPGRQDRPRDCCASSRPRAFRRCRSSFPGGRCG